MNPELSLLVFILLAQFAFASALAVVAYFIREMACRRFDRQDAAIADLRDQLDNLEQEVPGA